jgi:hypothetical protein
VMHMCILFSNLVPFFLFFFLFSNLII